MKKKKINKKVKSSEVAHVLNLFNQLAIKVFDCHFESNVRIQVRGLVKQISNGLDMMDETDEELQSQPENKKKNLRAEIIKNDELLKKNIENKKIQIQRGMINKGFPKSSQMHDVLLEDTRLEIEDLKIRIGTNYQVVGATFEFQKAATWVGIQLAIHKRRLKEIESSYEEILACKEEVERDIVKQNERIKIRRKQIIEELKELKVDVSDFDEKPPSYIN